jgi:hypothetical protein
VGSGNESFDGFGQVTLSVELQMDRLKRRDPHLSHTGYRRLQHS